MKPHLHCAEQQVSRSNLTKYCACHAERLAYFVLITYETSFTGRRATGVTIQPHQILRLSRRKTRILSPHHIRNVIYSARSNRCHDPTSPNTAPATQNCIAKFLTKSLKTDETSFPIRGRSENDPRMIREWSEHENANRNPPRKWGYFSRSPEAFSIVKYNVSSQILHSNIHQVLRLPQKVHIWNVIYTARSNRCHDPTSPNTAPVTQKDSHTLSSPHMKRHLQCAEQQVSRSNLTEYCACHAKLHCEISDKIFENRWNVISNKGTIREWSDHDPRMIRAWSEHENANRNPPRKWGYFSRSPEAFSIVKYNVSSQILHSNIHQVLRLPQKVTLELHQVLHLPRKVTLELHQILRLPLYCNWTLLYSTLLDSTWRIIPFSKWLVTMVSKFPK